MPRRYRRKRQRTFDHEVTLIEEVKEYDDIGNPEIIRQETIVFCDLESVGQSEFYDASTAGMKPEITFVIHQFEYNGEKLVNYDDLDYKVIRNYANDYEEIELTCERVVGNV